VRAAAGGNVFTRSLGLLARNPVMVVPGVAIGALAALTGLALEPVDPLDANLFTRALQDCTSLLASIVAIAYTTGMADAAWRTGRAAIADGARAFRRDGAQLFLAMLALFALGVVAAFAAPFSFGLSFLVYAFFCIYTPAAAVVGERPAFVAVRESAEIAFARPVTTLLVVAGIAVVCLFLSVLAEFLAGTSLLGQCAAEIVIQATVAYLTLVVVGEYGALRGVSASPGAESHRRG
jgi:hypothetical protein